MIYFIFEKKFVYLIFILVIILNYNYIIYMCISRDKYSILNLISKSMKGVVCGSFCDSKLQINMQYFDALIRWFI